MSSHRATALAMVLASAFSVAGAQQPRLTIEPRQPSGGSLVRLTIDHLDRHGDSVVAITGAMAGEPLHFRDATNGRQALGAIPVDVSDSLVAHVNVIRASGTVDTVTLRLAFPHHPPPVPQARGRAPGASRLRVDARFTRRLDSLTEARIEHENERARDVGHRAQATPQLWTLPFLRPRPARVTSRFGS